MTFTFYLGTPEPAWLGRLDVPLFVSHRRLRRRRSFPRALGPWALDSGGFTELERHGRWVTTAAEYVAAVRRYRDEIGGLQWVAPMDWMSEPFMLARTGLTVGEHQRRTVASYLELRAELGTLVVPVLQGYTLADYVACWELYDAAGVDLLDAPLVGLGSVCRRSSSDEAGELIRYLAGAGLRLHGFGLKGLTVSRCAGILASSDSQAWSYRARRAGVSSWSMTFALDWRARQLAAAARAPAGMQLAMRPSWDVRRAA